MKRISVLFGALSLFVLLSGMPASAQAQMMGNAAAVAATSGSAQEEAAGKAIFERIQSKQAACTDLSDDDFDVLGDYYMGQMMGASHETMNVLMEQRMGEDNERLMHIVMGKRLSGCDTSAVFPTAGAGFLPMMGMTGWQYSGGDGGYAYGRGMMGFSPYSMMGWGGYGWNSMYGWHGLFGGAPMILFWAAIILLIVWAVRKGSRNDRE